LWVESEISPEDLDMRLLRDLEKLSPFGPGNPKPLFLSRRMQLRGPVKKRGKDTLQCWMSDAGKNVTCEVIGFRAYERWNRQAATKREFDIVYQPTLRNFNGITSITLELESWQ
jgi:single-stranded-DNA-specific exonuclease